MARMRVGPLPSDKASGIATVVALRVISPQRKLEQLPALGRCSSGNLVESGVRNLVGFNPRSTVDHLRHDLGHFSIMPAVIGIGVLFVVPQTHTESFGAARGNERDFIP